MNYSYAYCIESFNGFKKDEIYRISDPTGKISKSCIYTACNLQNKIRYNNEEIDEIREDQFDKFIFILNSGISELNIIKEIFNTIKTNSIKKPTCCKNCKYCSLVEGKDSSGNGPEKVEYCSKGTFGNKFVTETYFGTDKQPSRIIEYATKPTDNIDLNIIHPNCPIFK